MNALLRTLAWMLALALVALPVVAVLQGWIGADRWPLRTLRVSGEMKRVDPALLRATLLPYAQHGFFAIRLDDAQAAVAGLPWVQGAAVRKRWPDVLEVRVVEHKPFARWGDDRLLSELGNLFPAASVTVPEGLPRFDAPEARIADVVALYNQSRTLFAPSGFDVRELKLDPRGSWSLVLSNGTQVVIGSSEARLRLNRFAQLMPQLLAQRQSPLTRADLRYTNGFALSWPDPAAKPATAPTGAPAAARPVTPAPAGGTTARPSPLALQQRPRIAPRAAPSTLRMERAARSALRVAPRLFHTPVSLQGIA